MHVLEWRTVHATMEKVILAFIKHQSNTRVSSLQFVTGVTYIILFLAQHNDSINYDKNDDLHTSTPCLTRSVNILLMTSQLIADDVTMTRQLWRDHVNRPFLTDVTGWLPGGFPPYNYWMASSPQCYSFHITIGVSCQCFSLFQNWISKWIWQQCYQEALFHNLCGKCCWTGRIIYKITYVGLTEPDLNVRHLHHYTCAISNISQIKKTPRFILEETSGLIWCNGSF